MDINQVGCHDGTSALRYRHRYSRHSFESYLTFCFFLSTAMTVTMGFHNVAPVSFHRPPTIRTSSLRPYQVIHQKSSCVLPLFLSDSSNNVVRSTTANASDLMVQRASLSLRRASWFSWWSQVILTTISSVTLLFAKSVLTSPGKQPGTLSSGIGGDGFFLAGTGIIISAFSIVWTWGAAARLSRRMSRSPNANNTTNPTTTLPSKKPMSRTKAANRLRRVVSVGISLNLSGMMTTILGALQIIGTLAAKILTTATTAASSSTPLTLGPSVQPLDILIVQANTNTLLSHFLSLVCLLSLTRSIDRLDPPSLDDDDDDDDDEEEEDISKA